MSRSQDEKVLQRLRRGPLTPIQALGELGVFRLAARVFYLRMRGHKIDSHLIRLPSGKHISQYRLVRS